MKKTIYLILVAFLMVMGCSKSDDVSVVIPDENQLKSALTKTISYDYSGLYYVDLICGELQEGYLLGVVKWHVKEHYEKDILIWSIYTPSGSLTNESTGEVFIIKESDKLSASEFTFHCKLLGNQGSHYILSGSGLLVPPWTVTIDKAVCPNGPKNQE